jgi:signal transduction histidine kinase
MSVERQVRWISRYPWRAAGVIGIVALGIGGLLYYVRDSVRTSNLMRIRTEMQRNRMTAQLGARMLDDQCDEAYRALQTMASLPRVSAALHSAKAGVAVQSIREMAGAAAGIRSLAAYTQAGECRFAVPASGADEEPLLSPSWLREAADLSRADTLPNGSLALVVPVTSGQGRVGYLVAQWLPTAQPKSMDAGLNNECGICVADHGGHVFVDDGEAPVANGELGADFEPLQQARTRASGMLTLFPPIMPQRMLVGYAVAARSGLVVIAMTPAERALGAMRFLIRRIGVIIAPSLVIVILAAWVLVTYFQKQQKLAQQLVEHNARLRDADRAKSDFLANVSHDLRTPLAGLRVSLTGLLDPDVQWDDVEVKAFLQVANEQVDQLSARVRNLLDMARVESDRQVIRKETCDLTDIAASAIERLRPQLKGRRIVTEFPPDPLFVECDQVQIGTVILNLLENAVKYSPENTPLTIRGAIGHPYATLTVCDAGPGITPEDEAKVFDKFYRSRSVASIGGTGLGLAICKTIIEQHGGRIGVRNGPQGGAEFWFSLPVPFINMAVDSNRGMV